MEKEKKLDAEVEEPDDEEVESDEDESEEEPDAETETKEVAAVAPVAPAIFKKFLDNDFPKGMYTKIVEHLKSFNDGGNFQEKLANSTQTFEQLRKYIVGEAKAFLHAQDGDIDNEIVYGWAVHFIDENIQARVSNNVSRFTVPTSTVQEAKKTVEVVKPIKPVEKVKSEKIEKPKKEVTNVVMEYEQLTLF
jgi:hypothetical protein